MNCVICSCALVPGMELNNIPSAAQAFTKTAKAAEKKCLSMSIFECSGCGTVQYNGPRVPYYKKVIRSAKFSQEMLKFRENQFRNFLLSASKNIDSVFEFGAGEGEYLDIFKGLGCTTSGIESSEELVSICQKKGHEVVSGFLGDRESQFYFNKKKYDCAVSFNFIEHLPNPKADLMNLSNILASDAVGLFEVPNFDLIERNKLFNEFIPDHRFYFREDTFKTLLSVSGFEVHSIKRLWNDYILSAVVSRRKRVNWNGFQNSRQDLKISIKNFFEGTRKNENVVWSAGHQSLATISNLQLTENIRCVIDSSEEKQTKFCPVSGLEVVSSTVLRSQGVKKVLVMAAGYNSEIIKKIRDDFRNGLIVAYIHQGKLVYDEENPPN